MVCCDSKVRVPVLSSEREGAQDTRDHSRAACLGRFRMKGVRYVEDQLVRDASNWVLHEAITQVGRGAVMGGTLISIALIP